MAPVIKKLLESRRLEVKVCITAQHRDMLDQVLQLFNITPDFDLDIMRPNQGLVDVTVAVLEKLPKVLFVFKPNLVIVHGDTSTAMAASLVSYYHRIPVTHVEAGLRSGNIYSPWPEEINRKIIGVIAQHHFAPTEHAKANLVREGVKKVSISVTGNTVIDALKDVSARLKNDSKLKQRFRLKYGAVDFRKKLILVTAHRRESIGVGLLNICSALTTIAERDDVQIIYPLHPNPNVQSQVRNRIGKVGNIILIEPLDYLSFVYLMTESHIILTDSGGVQEEAPSMGKPVLVLRETTERIEAVRAGTVKMVGLDRNRIVSEVFRLLDDDSAYSKSRKAKNPYGDGKSSKRIVDWIIKNASKPNSLV